MRVRLFSPGDNLVRFHWVIVLCYICVQIRVGCFSVPSVIQGALFSSVYVNVQERQVFVYVILYSELDTIMFSAGVVQEVLLSFCSVSRCSLKFSMHADVKEGAYKSYCLFQYVDNMFVICPRRRRQLGSNHAVTQVGS
jgi:hypothetical protein